ncbi:MAG: hypothetical protein MR033_02960 [Clostridiales bacterium]|nr:hypothetical protein [Clostridiales bacterium]
MKKHLSVFMLVARAGVYRLLALFILMTAAECALFRIGLHSSGLEHAVRASGTAIVFCVSFLLVTLLLCSSGCSFSSQPGYTLRRLSVSERSVFLWQAGYNAMTYLILWGVQVLAAFLLCRIYVSANPDSTSGQTVFLAFYRNAFLHSLLPLEETGRWVSNTALALGLGVCTAAIPFWQRRRKKKLAPVLMVLMAVLFFKSPLGTLSGNALLPIFTGILCTYTVRSVWLEAKEGCADEET